MRELRDAPNDATDDAPEDCPVCERAYDSASEHDAGVMVTLRDNERYRRVCFEPRDDGRLWFFHHTHAQTTNPAQPHGNAGRSFR